MKKESRSNIGAVGLVAGLGVGAGNAQEGKKYR